MEMKELLSGIIDSYREEMIETLSRWIRIRSVNADPEGDFPFGKDLQCMLLEAEKTVKDMGFDCRNVDNYCLEVNYGSGEKTMGILGHLDVVPEGKGWTHDPYGAEIENGKLYGRGTSDDKGPVVSALYALKAVREAGIELKDGVRMLMGLNEECGSRCIKHYNLSNPMPDYGFSPDADFPVINCEKGGLHIGIEGTVGSGSAFTIENLYAGERANIVPSEAKAELSGISLSELKALAAALPEDIGAHIEASEENGKCVVTAFGKGSHASLPEGGLNAAGLLLIALDKMGAGDKTIACLAEKLGTEYTGEKIGIRYSDEESGVLTCNLGLMRFENRVLTITLDIRYPITADPAKLTENASQILSPDGLKVSQLSCSKPLYVPKDHPVVQGLLRAYEAVSGQKGYTIAIGGGTYARTMDNCVAFGNAYPGTDNSIHSPDEFVILDELVNNAKMFAMAIVELAGKK